MEIRTKFPKVVSIIDSEITFYFELFVDALDICQKVYLVIS